MNNDFLNQSVEFIKGVGPSRSKLLNDELNIKTVKDLIDFYPFRYIDRMNFFKINELPLNNSEVQIIGKIKSIKKLMLDIEIGLIVNFMMKRVKLI